jgi:uncharacterized membrane protein YeiH
MAMVLGMISGIGGGMVRDVLTARTWLGLPQIASAIVGAVLCVCLRLVALYRGWRLPVAPRRQDEPSPPDDREGW